MGTTGILFDFITGKLIKMLRTLITEKTRSVRKYQIIDELQVKKTSSNVPQFLWINSI